MKVFNTDMPCLDEMVRQIYPVESQLNKTIISDVDASCLDVHL